MGLNGLLQKYLYIYLMIKAVPNVDNYYFLVYRKYYIICEVIDS
jgi:hypothetical protein